MSAQMPYPLSDSSRPSPVCRGVSVEDFLGLSGPIHTGVGLMIFDISLAWARCLRCNAAARANNRCLGVSGEGSIKRWVCSCVSCCGNCASPPKLSLNLGEASTGSRRSSSCTALLNVVVMKRRTVKRCIGFEGCSVLTTISFPSISTPSIAINTSPSLNSASFSATEPLSMATTTLKTFLALSLRMWTPNRPSGPRLASNSKASTSGISASGRSSGS
mmetsp:Transcript_53420/g.122765  ORF Transcript_53420/g.122765 Transcript_53420/m.122765 type:complete len:218 (+) Transcript_53420:265-918(+)